MEATTNKMLEAALQYAQNGLAVIPLRANSKIPATSHGVKDATTDINQIIEWFGDTNYNIGIACGAASGGLVVIDCDRGHADGIDGVSNFQQLAHSNFDLKNTMMVNTPAGGMHIYYKVQDSTKIKNSAGGLCDGVDVRSDNGYVVAAPSAIEGKSYTITQDHGLSELSHVSDTLYTYLSDMSNARKSDTTNVQNTDLSDLSQGSRNDTLFRTACSLRSKGLPEQSILTVLRSVNQTDCKPPLGDTEVLAIFGSAMRYDGSDSGVSQASGTEVANECYKEINGVKLMAKPTKNGDLAVINNTENVARILRDDKTLAGKIAFDSRSYELIVREKLSWHDNSVKYPCQWRNIDESHLVAYIDRVYGINTEQRYKKGINIVADENKFNPIVDYFDSLVWDGKRRVDTLLHDCLGCEQNSYTAEAMRLWMRGAVKRAKEPGCKFDYMLTMTGAQGLGKSSFLMKLAHNSKWNCDNFSSIDGDQALQKLRGKWIVELAELLAVKKTREVEAIKAFLTSQEDTFRTPYDRFAEDHPRACVFAATTNELMFLTDATGNRRYLLVECGVEKPNIDMFADDFDQYVDQCWAEIIAMEDGSPLVLSDASETYRSGLLAGHSEEDSRVGMVIDYLNNHQADRVCVPEIIDLVLNQDPRTAPRYVSTDIHRIISQQPGWSRLDTKTGKGNTANYGVQICYEYTGDVKVSDVEELHREMNSLLEEFDEKIDMDSLELV